MDDEISGGNGFQEYLMTYGGKDEKHGWRIRGEEDRSNRSAVFGKGVDKRVQHIKKVTSQFQCLSAYNEPLVDCVDHVDVCSKLHR